MSSMTFHSGVTYNSHCSASKLGQYGTTVNSIAPGVVRTETTAAGPHAQWFDTLAQQQAIKRTEVPEDLVGPLSLLVSGNAAFVTGQTLYVDGGMIRA